MRSILLVINVLCLILTISSCAHKKKINEGMNENQEHDDMKGENGQELEIEKNLNTISRRLKELEGVFRKQGKHALNYMATDIFLKASMASMAGDSITASLLLKYLSSLKPKDLFLKKKLAIELIKNGQLNEAQKILKTVFEKDKNDEEAGLILAGIYVTLLDINKAKDIYKVLLKRNPQNQDACIFLAKSYVSENKQNKSIKLLSKCQKAMPRLGIFSYYIGQLFEDLGQKKKALMYFKESLQREPNYYYSVLALGEIYERKDNLQKAYAVYRKFLDSNPTNEEVLIKIVQILFTLNKYKLAIPYLNTLVHIDPDDLNLKVKLATLYNEVNNYKKALNIFEDLHKVVPDSSKIIFYLGALYQQTNQLDKSQEFFCKIEKKDPLFKESRLLAAKVLLKLAISNSDQYRSQFMEMVDENYSRWPSLENDMQMLAAVYLEYEGKLDEAIDILEELREKKGNDSKRDYFLATLYDKNKNFEKSYKIVKEILAKSPQNAHAWNFLGYSLVERGIELNQAYNYIQRALALDPKDAYIRDTLGWYYYKKGNFKKAIKEIEMAKETIKDDLVIFRHLALAYKAAKKNDLASKYFKKILDESDDESIKAEAQKALRSMGYYKRERLPASQK